MKQEKAGFKSQLFFIISMKKSFKPIVNSQTHSLFLGTLPGEVSLAENKYYAHPQNKFWRLIYDLFEQEYDVNYDNRMAFLIAQNFGLWDVVQRAEREGSLDSAIKNLQVNDFKLLLEAYPNLKNFYFTSKQAYQWYYKTYKDSLPVSLIVLASPSPANARMTYAEKFNNWKVKILK